MTLDQITYNISNILEGGIVSDDTSPSTRQIEFWVNYYRALFIRRDFDNKGGAFDMLPFAQDLGCVPLEKVDSAECCDVEIGCNVLRTTFKIPNTVRIKATGGFTFIGSIDKKHNYQIITPSEARFYQYRKFTGKLPKALIRNGYVYILNSKIMKAIDIQGVFEDPIKAGKIGCDCMDGQCITPQSEYPCALDYIPQITSAVLSLEAKVLLGTHQDTEEDAIDNSRA